MKGFKYKFEQKSLIAEDHLTQVTNSKQTANNKNKGLIEFYYSLSECVITLLQLKYESSIYNTDTVRETIHYLPNKF